jgi:hypothetical protein
MNKRVLGSLAVALGAACLTAVALAAAPIQLPALTRIASRLSGLQATRQVRVVTVSAPRMRNEALRVLDRDYPPDQQAYDQSLYRALGLLPPGGTLRPALTAELSVGVRGLYDPLIRTLFVRSSTDRSALVHELVHALQDQAFDLRRLTALRRGNRDAASAAAAAVEGDAVFATEVLGGHVLAFAPPPRRLASHNGSKMAEFLALEHGFPYSTGLRFIATLHNLGGNRAIFTALRTFPRTTEQIFHIDAFLAREAAVPLSLPQELAGLSLRRADTWGELDIRALLAVFQVPRLDHVGEGWGGGRTGLYTDGAGREILALSLVWDSEDDAAQWQEAVSTFVNEAFDADNPGFPAPVRCATATCWSVAGRSIAFERQGLRTALVFAPAVDTAAGLARAVAGS